MAIPALSRRAVLRGVLVTAVGGVAGYLTVRSSAAGESGGTAAANAYGRPAEGAAAPLISLDRLPAGGVVVLPDARLVLTRSSGGDVHALSADCTHQGCVVGASGGVIQCPCHGSRFAADTGAVTRGPATRPLASVPVVVRNGEVYRS